MTAVHGVVSGLPLWSNVWQDSAGSAGGVNVQVAGTGQPSRTTNARPEAVAGGVNAAPVAVS